MSKSPLGKDGPTGEDESWQSASGLTLNTIQAAVALLQSAAAASHALWFAVVPPPQPIAYTDPSSTQNFVVMPSKHARLAITPAGGTLFPSVAIMHAYQLG